MLGRVTSSLGAVERVAGINTASGKTNHVLTEVQRAAEQWAKKFLQKNHGAALPQKSTQEQLLRRMSIGSGQKRGIVTAPTMTKLKAIDGSLTLPATISPYQQPSGCEVRAKAIMIEAHNSSKARHANEVDNTAGQNADEKSGNFWGRLIKKIWADSAISSVELENADQLLNLYNKYGPFVLRSPSLDDPRQNATYVDHAIAIMAAVKIMIGGRERIVFSAIDCNDIGKDEETTAARALATELGKDLSDLTHAEADSVGADRRRIRLIDGDWLVDRSWKFFLELQTLAIDVDAVVYFMPEGAPILTDEQTSRLKELVAENWSEVESGMSSMSADNRRP